LIYVDLILNLALLVALSIVSGFIERHPPRHPRLGVMLQGLLFGGAAVLGMLRPMNWGPGIIFDGRSVMISLCALFFGPVAGTIAAALAVACRVGLVGGGGIRMGVLVILSSALIGLLARRRLQPEKTPPSTRTLYDFGLAVHVAMVLLMFTLPREAIFPTIARVGVSVLLLYPLATILAGHILADNVTAIRRLDELRDTNAFLENLIGHASSPIVVWDASLRITRFNQACEKLTGQRADEVLGSSVESLFPDSGEQLRATLSGECWLGIERTVAHRDGSLRTVLWNSSTIFAADGATPVAVIVQGQDITSRKQAEAERAELQSQLEQAQRMESIGRLAGGVAHDFNNMLQAVIGYAEMALEELPTSHPIYDDIAEIHQVGHRAADLTAKLLAFARRQTITPRVLDLNAVVANMNSMLERLIGENITLVWQPGERLWPVKMDPSQMDQILVNLCINARDAINGIGTLTIATANLAIPPGHRAFHGEVLAGDYVQISVRDSGCGMSRETLDHLFEPFFTTKEMGKGTGLGLATVYGAVQQNGGFVEVSSAPGEGSVFHICLPRCETPPPETLRAEPPAGAAAQGSETLLLVEDDAHILQSTLRVLLRQGYTVLAANTPDDAIRIAREHPGTIDLVLTDVIMPGMNGLELTGHLQALRPGLRTLFMSGHPADVIARQGIIEEGIRFIKKPFSNAALAASIREALTAAPTVPPASPEPAEPPPPAATATR
jgi:PAS domain S-box-containing protein